MLIRRKRGSSFASRVLRVTLTFVMCATVASVHAEEGGHHIARTSIELDGVSSGGALALLGPTRRTALYVSVTNQPGDSAATVAARLAEAANSSPEFIRRAGTVAVTNSRLTGLTGRAFGGEFSLAGTETGLGIPPPPKSCSASYDFEHDQTCLSWENSSQDYDRVSVVCDGVPVGWVPGGQSSFLQAGVVAASSGFFDPNGLDYSIVAYIGETPSAPGVVHLAGERQEELADVPFISGVAPNWSAWTHDMASADFNLSQGLKIEIRRDLFFKTAAQKPSYQCFAASGMQYTCGTWRKFLGLTSGLTYRVLVRVNTLDTPGTGSWSFSIHAAHNGSAGTTLTEAQLSGSAALPDGSQGADAGRIVEYGGATTTDGKWMLHTTDTPGPGKVIGNISLPQDVDTITLWTRLTGTDTSVSGVGVDWVAIEPVAAK